MTQRSDARRKHTCKQLGTKLNLEKRRNTLISIEQSFWRKSAPSLVRWSDEALENVAVGPGRA